MGSLTHDEKEWKSALCDEIKGVLFVVTVESVFRQGSETWTHRSHVSRRVLHRYASLKALNVGWCSICAVANSTLVSPGPIA